MYMWRTRRCQKPEADSRGRRCRMHANRRVAEAGPAPTRSHPRPRVAQRNARWVRAHEGTLPAQLGMAAAAHVHDETPPKPPLCASSHPCQSLALAPVVSPNEARGRPARKSLDGAHHSEAAPPAPLLTVEEWDEPDTRHVGNSKPSRGGERRDAPDRGVDGSERRFGSDEGELARMRRRGWTPRGKRGPDAGLTKGKRRRSEQKRGRGRRAAAHKEQQRQACDNTHSLRCRARRSARGSPSRGVEEIEELRVARGPGGRVRSGPDGARVRSRASQGRACF